MITSKKEKKKWNQCLVWRVCILLVSGSCVYPLNASAHANISGTSGCPTGPQGLLFPYVPSLKALRQCGERINRTHPGTHSSPRIFPLTWRRVVPVLFWKLFAYVPHNAHTTQPPLTPPPPNHRCL